MTVLHIIYKHHPQTSKADYDGFYEVITSYQWRRLSDSNWAINVEEPPTSVWQKLKRCIDPNDYLVMMPQDRSLLTPQDWKALRWLLSRP